LTTAPAPRRAYRRRDLAPPTPAPSIAAPSTAATRAYHYHARIADNTDHARIADNTDTRAHRRQ